MWDVDQKRVGRELNLDWLINYQPDPGTGLRASYMGILNARTKSTYAHTNPQFSLFPFPCSLLPFPFSVLLISLASGMEYLHSRFLPTRFDREAGIMKRMDREETDGNWGE